MRRSIRWAAVGAGIAGRRGGAGLRPRPVAHALPRRARKGAGGRGAVPAGHPGAVEVVAEAPGDARAHYYLGLAYAGVGLCGAASIHLDEAARLAPEYRRLRAGLGLGLPECRVAGNRRARSISRSRLTAKEEHSHEAIHPEVTVGCWSGAGLVGPGAGRRGRARPAHGLHGRTEDAAVDGARAERRADAGAGAELGGARQGAEAAVVNVSTKRVEGGSADARARPATATRSSSSTGSSVSRRPGVASAAWAPGSSSTATATS